MRSPFNPRKLSILQDIVDGGALTDTAGITVGSGATLIGFGKVTGVIAGSGAVVAAACRNLLSDVTLSRLHPSM